MSGSDVHNFGMNQIEIYLDKHRAYSPGDSIYIEVIVSIQQARKIHALNVQFTGSEISRISNDMNVFLANKVEYTPNDIYSKKKTIKTLLQVRAVNDYSAWVGRHIFRVKVALPTICPSSFSTSTCAIEYLLTAKVTLQDQRNSAEILNTKLKVNIQGLLYDSLFIEKRLCPLSMCEKKSFIMSSGHLYVSYKINKSVFQLGDAVNYDIKIHNKTFKKLGKMHLILIQRVEVRKTHGFAHEETKILKMPLDTTQNGDSKEWVSNFVVPLSLSETIEPRRMQNADFGTLVHISYRIKLRIEVQNAQTIRISIPIYIVKKYPDDVLKKLENSYTLLDLRPMEQKSQKPEASLGASAPKMSPVIDPINHLEIPMDKVVQGINELDLHSLHQSIDIGIYK